MSPVSFLDGDVIARQGKPLSTFFIVRSGTVRVIMTLRKRGAADASRRAWYNGEPGEAR